MSDGPPLREAAAATSVAPHYGVDGGRFILSGDEISPADGALSAWFGEDRGYVTFVANGRMGITVPEGVDGGLTPIRVNGLPGDPPRVTLGTRWVTGIHQVDSPAINPAGQLFATCSGSRGQEVPVSLFKADRAGAREPFVTGIVNATSLAWGPDGALYVSSRYDGTVYRVDDDGSHEAIARELGVSCGLAFDKEGWMYVGDRSGTIFRVRDGRTTAFAVVPPSVAAFHLAMRADGTLLVTGPTLGPSDSVYRIDRLGNVQTLPVRFGRPQGLAFSPAGVLHVVEALAGASGLYRVPENAPPELVVAAEGLVGVAFGPNGECVVTTNDTAFRFDELGG